MTESRNEMNRVELVLQLRALGVEEGGVLLVHSSYRAMRPIAGGPLTVIQALTEAIGPRGTLVMPSWCEDDDGVPFDPAVSSALALGVIADTFWRQAGVIRSDHASAFAARGPEAVSITADPLPLPPHIAESPVGRVHERDGQVLLLGIGHDANTTIHLAECLARVPYGVRKEFTALQDGREIRVAYEENDHCCQGFALMDDWLRTRNLQREGRVGHAHARLFRSRDVVTLACEQLARDPLIFLHPESAGCSDCDEARASVGRGSG